MIALIIYIILFVSILLISNIKAVNSWIQTLLAIVRPVTIGLAISYLANPFFRFFERRLLVRIRNFPLRRALSLLLTYLLLLLIVALLLVLIVPQLISSMRSFMDNFDANLSRLLTPVNALIGKINGLLPAREDGTVAISPINDDRISEAVSGLWEYLIYLFREQIGFSDISRFFSVLTRAASGLTTFIFGVFLSIYLLASKEKRYAQIMKFRRAVFKDSVNRRITHICTVADRSFGGFLRGKVLDALIVGLLTYAACLIFRIPYPLLVATVIGLTDIIPVIGPFLGAIPMGIIILLADPFKVILFAASILVIQQIDGNVISPKILGESTGISSLTVLISIILMGHLQGLFGMLIGVPLFATVLELLDVLIERRLEAKGLPGNTDEYYSPDTIGRPTGSARERRRAKREAERRAILLRDTGSGYLTGEDLEHLAACRIARREKLCQTVSEDALERFRSEWLAAQTSDPGQPGEAEEEVPADPTAPSDPTDPAEGSGSDAAIPEEGGSGT